MADDADTLRLLYENFNARNIDAILPVLTEDVAWANGMEGGHVRGREAVRQYWTRQWAVVSPEAVPLGFGRTADGAMVVDVRQTVRDLEGRPLQGQDHGLRDKVVRHLFRMVEGRVARFDIDDGPA